MEDLRTRISRLPRESLDLYKREAIQKSKDMPTPERERIYLRIKDIPELSDVAPYFANQQTQQYPQDLSFWQQAWKTGIDIMDIPENYFMIPMVAATAEPLVREAQGNPMSLLEKAWQTSTMPVQAIRGLAEYQPGSEKRKAYEAWQAPEIPLPYDTSLSTKSIAEFLPWLAVPGATQVGKGLQSSGNIAVRGLGKAIEYSPWGLTEKATGAIGGMAGKGLKKIAKTVVPKVQTIFALSDDAPDFAKNLIKKIKIDDAPVSVGGRLKGANANWNKKSGTLTFKTLSDIGDAGTVNHELMHVYIDSLDTDNAAKFISDYAKSTNQIYQKWDFGRDLYSWSESIAQDFRRMSTDPDKMSPELFQFFIDRDLTPVTKNVIQSVNLPSPDAAVQKLIDVIKKTKQGWNQARELTEELRGEELSKRAGILASTLNKATDLNQLSSSAGVLKGALPVSATPFLKGQFSKEEERVLTEVIKSTSKLQPFEKLNAGQALNDMLTNARIPTPSEMELLKVAFGSDLVKAILQKRPLTTKVASTLIDVSNATRATMASGDVSAPLRQGLVLSVRHPLASAKSMGVMFKSMLSDANLAQLDDAIKANADYEKLKNAGLYLAPLEGVISKREEAFASNIIGEIPVLKDIVRASNRAYNGYLNSLRSEVFYSTAKAWDKVGASNFDYHELAKLINYSTGRGDLPSFLKGSSSLLNATIFSPRLMFSRLQLPTMLASQSPLARKEAVKTLATFLGVGAGVLGLLKLGGAKIDLDPRSGVFGKAKIGNTYLDIWGGYSQYVRLAGQFWTAQRATESGDIHAQNRIDTLYRFLQSKGSPAFSLFVDLMKGETYEGESTNLDQTRFIDQLWKRSGPLFVQDLVDSIHQNGAIKGGLLAVPSAFGAGVQTYVSEAKKLKDTIANRDYSMDWDALGQQPNGKLIQMKLEQNSPELQAALKTEDEKYSRTIAGQTNVHSRYRREGQTIENNYNNEIQLATQELRSTGNLSVYREKINRTNDRRRSAYNLRDQNPDYAEVTADYNKPPQNMNPQELMRWEYNQILNAPDMVDSFGNYRFDLADQRKAQFVRKYGEEALGYVEEYNGIRRQTDPPELKQLRQMQKIAAPFWQIEDDIWRNYPPELRQAAEQIAVYENNNDPRAKQLLMMNPTILWIRKQIAQYRKRMKMMNPAIQQALAYY